MKKFLLAAAGAVAQSAKAAAAMVRKILFMAKRLAELCGKNRALSLRHDERKPTNRKPRFAPERFEYRANCKASPPSEQS